MSIDLTKLKAEYTSSGIDSNKLNKNPISQFQLWLQQSIDAGIKIPHAMSLATTNNTNPSIRTVLLKSFDDNGFVFFTNYNSNKSKQIQYNPNVALLFAWLELERQVIVSGVIKKISKLESEKYFNSRSKQSKLSAWASKQSSKLCSREELLAKFSSMEKKFDKEIPLPDFWGGYLVVPKSIEFWQGRENRLHDRFIYNKENSKWLISRLAP
jgi:pyridoxamine 5'-phosphate oxidase